MKFLKKIKETITGFSKALSRYPLTIIFLVAAAIVNALTIEQGEDYSRYLFTFLIGASLSCTLQAIWERFFDKTWYRFLLMGVGIVMTFIYFLIILPSESISTVMIIRTMVIIFALLISYIWVPSIKRISFNDSFLIAFKAFFNALLFSLILYLGITLILGATDLLLFKIPSNLYEHNLNFVGIIFAPIYFLSLIPLYPGSAQKNLLKTESNINWENYQKARVIPKFLEILISYIIIPLLSIYTVILLTYIFINISGEFWSDNRLEPMLVGFSIAVIVINILASKLENPFSHWFRTIAPKVLVLVVLFQIIASILRIQEMGITASRYYVILFGFFAIISGVIMSIKPVAKNGIIAILFIGFSLFSVIPPLDAFTISYNNQFNRLTNVLNENNMIKNNQIIPNSEILKKDQKIISDSVNYLAMMDYQIPYLGKDFDLYEDFYDTFGFYQYIEDIYDDNSIYLDLDPEAAIDISNYDIMLSFNLYDEKEDQKDSLISAFEKDGRRFSLWQERKSQPGRLLLKDEFEQTLIALELKEVFDYFETLNNEAGLNQREALITPEEATFTMENEEMILSLIARFIAINNNSDKPFYNGDFYLMIKIKE